MKKIAASLAALALGGGLAATAIVPAEAATAHRATVRSTVTINNTPVISETKVTIKGTVKANSGCKNNRTVKLRQVDQGVSVGSAKTDKDGKWKVTFAQSEVEPGKFKATVLKVKRGRTTCAADTDTAKIGG